jgi:DNA-binding CsgD family transcriptional regulator
MVISKEEHRNRKDTIQTLINEGLTRKQIADRMMYSFNYINELMTMYSLNTSHNAVFNDSRSRRSELQGQIIGNWKILEYTTQARNDNLVQCLKCNQQYKMHINTIVKKNGAYSCIQCKINAKNEVNKSRKDTIQKLIEQGLTRKEIAKSINLSLSRTNDYIREYDLNTAHNAQNISEHEFFQGKTVGYWKIIKYTSQKSTNNTVRCLMCKTKYQMSLKSIIKRDGTTPCKKCVNSSEWRNKKKLSDNSNYHITDCEYL